MKKFIQSEILYGAILTLITSFLYITQRSFVETLELKFYDLRAALRQSDKASKEIAIVEIDDGSLAKLGRWPWPRSRMAKLLEYLTQEPAKPKVIGFDILLSEPEQNLALVAADTIKGIYEENINFKKTTLAQHEELLKAAKKKKQPAWLLEKTYALWSEAFSKDQTFLIGLETIKQEMNNDTKLDRAISGAGNVVLPLYLQLGEGVGAKPAPLPAELGKSLAATMRSMAQGGPAMLVAHEATVPVVAFASSAIGAGHVNTTTDIDGVVRQEPLAIAYGDATIPSFALEIARHYLGLSSDDIVVMPGVSIEMGETTVPLDGISRFNVTYNGPERSFPYYSFFDVVEGKVQPEAFKNKIVLVGPTASGVGSMYVTPLAANFPGVEIIANVIDNILHKKFLIRPAWAEAVELGLIVLTGLFISLLLPRLKALPGALISLGAFLVMIGAGIYLFTMDQWIKVTYPALLLAGGYTLVVSKRFLVTERKKELVEGESVETNKMLGLSFQGQGMLDLAFEKFRKIPLDDTVKDLLYNLALDFERKRQFNKAVAVYEHIAGKDAKYKDIQQKIEALKKAAQGIITGPIGKSKEATLLVEGASIAPTLGRYEIVKELGKGAMGIVYLGRDPKINRQVAIKTMRFEDDVDEAAAKAIKERFFREAESAGNLSHPNIVKIYDAGEEQDISYIAMELLEGEDLKQFTNKEHLLSVEKTVDYAIKVAEALDYAHAQGIVHRDIKPANIMLLKEGAVRVTDFGIARITASSKTATGTVLGTPSYMSPEQIAGKKVDGRADLFSLGVCLFELLTGEKPWKGGESIGTLLFQIANEPHPDPLTLRADIPPGLVAIINKALQKNPDKRYQRGAEMAADLKNYQNLATREEKSQSPEKPQPPAAAPGTAAGAGGAWGAGGTEPALIRPEPETAVSETPQLVAKNIGPAPQPVTTADAKETDKTIKLDAAPLNIMPEIQAIAPSNQDSRPKKKIPVILDDFEKTLPIMPPPRDEEK